MGIFESIEPWLPPSVPGRVFRFLVLVVFIKIVLVVAVVVVLILFATGTL